MRHFSFTVFGDPKGQPRARAFARKVGAKWVARVYDAGTAEGWKSLIAAAAREAGLQNLMLEGPICLNCTYNFQRPKSHYRTGKNSGILRDDAPAHWHTSKPDRDNIDKALKDTLTQIGVWRDDSQVCAGLTTKVWSNTSAFSLIEISLMED